MSQFTSEWLQQYEHRTNRRKVPHPQPERNEVQPLARPAPGKTKSVARIIVRFTGYRARPIDPDNFAGSVKDLLDGLRHAGLIPGDEHWRIKLETDQVKVATYDDERTLIEIEYDDSQTSWRPAVGNSGPA